MSTYAIVELTGDQMIIFSIVAFLSAYIILYENSRIREIEQQLRDAGVSLSTMTPGNQIPFADRQPSPEIRSSRRSSRQASPDTGGSRQRQRRREPQRDRSRNWMAEHITRLFDALRKEQGIVGHLAQAEAQRASSADDFQKRFFSLARDNEEMQIQMEESDRWREGLLDDVQHTGDEP